MEYQPTEEVTPLALKLDEPKVPEMLDDELGEELLFLQPTERVAIRANAGRAEKIHFL